MATMHRRTTLAILGTAVAAAGAAWFLGMRNGWRPVVDTQRRVNRDVLNPRMLRRIGQPGGPNAVVHHTGRRTGRAYSNPVDAVPGPEGFVVASVYGSRSDWIRNVLGGGPAAIETEGHTWLVGDARLVPIAEVADLFPPATRRSHRLFGVSEAVVLRTVREAEPFA